MSTKSSRSGGKYTDSHTTIIPATTQIIDFVHNRPEVTKVALGYINARLSPSRVGAHVKIGYEQNNCILLQIRGNNTLQEIRAWTNDPLLTKLAIAKELRNKKINISFEKKH